MSGFPNERISVLPRPRLKEMLTDPINSHLLVTDCGYFPNAQDHERHRPTGCAETIVIFCVDGKGWAQVDGTDFTVKPGQALVVPQGRPHSYGASADHPWTIWWMHMQGKDVLPFLEVAGVSGESAVVNVQDLAGVVNLFQEILTLMEHDESSMTLQQAGGAGWHLLTHIAVSRNRTTVSRLHPTQIAVARLQRDFAKEVSVSALAKEVGLSISHFSALFREATGFGPRLYQTRLRMLKARQLLDTTDLAVSQIARLVGYQDPLYFSRRFQLIHKVTPTEHRSRAKG